MGLTIKPVTDPAFRKYGKVVTGYDAGELLEKMKETPLPDEVVYVASVKELEELAVSKKIEKKLYGQLPIQVGYCNGHNKNMNAVEYHRNSEINVAVTDLILILGRQQDIAPDYTYDSGNMEAFLVPAGTMIEVYATTLHYAPCHVSEKGFRCVVILPKDTNTDLEPAGEAVNKEDRLLFAKNKWLIGHKEGGLPEHAYIGISGENLSV
ncbi:DUF4867 family protein [Lacrimispora saccharolytica]|uniref:DUF4867 domain-containing protein n=1 Tax=Lacrimispora saccharolytica (strain ATCC 35040 / DSM 2544 / NRCC 2533 / WM1) TaxID=610130 RepID=D9R8Y4_LACSW|nr:DUF4867 family protein [Lacrimispora saccharolytica]ADL03959.1 conserved hypothetical protein [[Clostridium] saccharolyticum WM1]QRV21734.1 DUF4867 family protein [Lacrimispora saccharolytica]